MQKCFACSGADWSCTLGGSGKLESKNKVTLTNGNIPILTTKNKPKFGSGICKVGNGTTCAPVVFPLWRKVSKITCCGNKALLNGSYIPCFRGGTITIESPEQEGIVYNDSFLSCPKFSSLSKSYQKMLEKQAERQDSKNRNHKKDSYKKKQQKASSFHLASDNSKVKKHLSKITQDKGVSLEEPTKISAPTTNILSDQKTQPESPSPPVLSAAHLRQKHWCSGNCPKEYKNNCGFRCAPCQLRHENDSVSLKKNLRSKHYSLYELVENISNIQHFSIAHHHLIPGNECYGKMDGDHYRYELLLKLGYFFNYDINIGENGILLPSPKNTSGAGETNRPENAKAEQYYNLMGKDLHNNNLLMTFSQTERSFVGSQLHCGPHTYEQPLKNLRKEHPEAHKIRSYEAIVIAELDLLSDFYMDMYEDACFMKDYEKSKKEFFNRITSISNRLKERINQFPNKNKTLGYLNKRVYVSFPAVLYDMNITLTEYQEKYLNQKNTLYTSG